ncbi:aspartate aminotransferase family protein [Cloacibacillus evryensis]|uniref:Aspartate aminotransferase family protein n=3 Tax=Cloacibacillus evryensis TaxID=508460 RepID=A0AAW5KAI0_9BACT|nr:aspartate aminotransferase family protein [Cloacibacillus evryensis]EHL66762.1 glutamate-1-semialdehyde-2,1-aminomutase [Synergistes sp. 3_1_syn1]EXG78717.1 glutamate-1-semialdehyde aminotransferase [Cloacibacillus evryensis DSM 19522]MCQ4815024.1 aspartate aminotransferase family protein [Cloacibacillus evryensis]MEA5036624.1 aspartate aminotransferase family protein [Cloacibacillus evryensis]
MYESFEKRSVKSKQLFDRAMKVFVEGANSPSRGIATCKPYPIYVRDGKGGRLFDADGNSYIDLMLGFSANIMGHGHPKIVEAVTRAIQGGSHFAACTEIEVKCGEKFLSMIKNADKVRFGNTGTEAVMMAVRLARAVTGKKKILKFEGQYHGWYDGLLANCHTRPVDTMGAKMDPVKMVEGSGIPQEHIENLVICPWNDLEILEKMVKCHKHELAAIITEPIMANVGVILPKKGYLEGLQRIAKENDVLFILDEVVTGFRYGNGCYQDMAGLNPDISTFGKALGAGLPVSAIAGREGYMQEMQWGKALSYGTFNSARLPMEVSYVNMTEMTKDDCAGYRHIHELGEMLINGSRQIIKDLGIPVIVQGYGPMLQYYFTEKEAINDVRDYAEFADKEKYQTFARKLLCRGLYVTSSNGLHHCPCLQHTKEDFAEALNIIEDTFKEMKSEGIL